MYTIQAFTTAFLLAATVLLVEPAASEPPAGGLKEPLEQPVTSSRTDSRTPVESAEKRLEEPKEKAPTKPRFLRGPKSIDDLRAIQDLVRKVVQKARPATVAVELEGSIGSGVVISADGLVLTAGHVSTEPNRSVWLRFADNRRVRGLTLGVNHPVDSGMIRITEEAPSEAGWPHVKLAEEGCVQEQWVVAIGHPNGYFVGRKPPVRLGRVLYLRDGMIQTDATLVGGDSGGPLLNLDGELVGIHSRIGERITSNYHVPVTSYRDEWERLLTGAMTGVPDDEDPDDSRPLLGLAARYQQGQWSVTQLFEKGAAAEAGVQIGDRLLSLSGRSLGTPEQLAQRVARIEPYSRVPLTLERDGEELTVELWIGRTDRFFPGLASELPRQNDDTLRNDSEGGR